MLFKTLFIKSISTMCVQNHLKKYAFNIWMEPITQADYSRAVRYLEKVSAYNKLYYQRKKADNVQKQEIQQVERENLH